jgi:heptosyltransferase-1
MHFKSFKRTARGLNWISAAISSAFSSKSYVTMHGATRPMRSEAALQIQASTPWFRNRLQQVKTGIRLSAWRILLPMHGMLFGNRRPSSLQEPRRILLLNGGHLGDVVIATGVLPVLRSAFPDAEIGFACGSWARDVIRDHPEITYTHTVDHWKLIRARIPWHKKWRRYQRCRKQFLGEIEAVRYDWAVSLFWRPDFLDLAWRAGIPVRAAFAQRFSALTATSLAPAFEYNFLMTEGARHADLLRTLGVGEKHLQLRRACLPYSSEDAVRELEALLPDPRAPYCILHMGAGARARELTASFWHELAQSLSSSCVVLFTGHGEREFARIEKAIGDLGHCVNACNKLSWKGLVATVRRARRVYSVDTAVAHLAAATNTPLDAVYTGITGVGRWRPEGQQFTVWTQHVPCTPCFKAEGCGEMTCLNGIVPSYVLGTISAPPPGNPPPNDSAAIGLQSPVTSL